MNLSFWQSAVKPEQFSAVQSPSLGGRWRGSCLNPTELGSVPFHQGTPTILSVFFELSRGRNILILPEGVYGTNPEWHASGPSLPDTMEPHYVAWNFGHRSQ